jgi:hypothetical protein
MSRPTLVITTLALSGCGQTWVWDLMACQSIPLSTTCNRAGSTRSDSESLDARETPATTAKGR